MQSLMMLWVQHRQTIFLSLLVLLAILSIAGGVFADGPITGGGGCSGC